MHFIFFVCYINNEQKVGNFHFISFQHFINFQSTFIKTPFC